MLNILIAFRGTDSNVRQSSMLAQLHVLTDLLEKLDGADSTAVSNLNTLRAILVKPDKMAIHLAADWSKINDLNIDLTAPWMHISKQAAEVKE